MSLLDPGLATASPKTEKAVWQKVVRRVRIPLGIASTLLFLAAAQPTWASLATGLPAVLAGVALRSYASGYLSKNRRLATTGPYAYTRNPLYLGSLVMAAGFAWMGHSLPLALGLGALFAAVYIPTILSEERYLRAKFPEFDDYVRAVPRLLPRPTPARLDGEGGFSRALFLKHKEYNAWIGAGALVLALALRIAL